LQVHIPDDGQPSVKVMHQDGQYSCTLSL